VTAAAILADANPATFPTDLLPGIDSALALFGAGFLGRNDVVHLWAAGVPNVVVVDTDEGKIEEMARLYERPAWTWLVDDAYKVALEWGDGPLVDLVVVDPWTGGIAKALNSLELWLRLAHRFLVIGVCRDWFDAYHVAPTLDGFNKWLARQYWRGAAPPPASRLVPRSDYRGGTFWLIFEV